jgi:hypothetical protein
MKVERCADRRYQWAVTGREWLQTVYDWDGWGGRVR